MSNKILILLFVLMSATLAIKAERISGTIADKYNVSIVIFKNIDNTVTGYYYYIDKNIPIDLEGTYSEKSGYKLTEYITKASGERENTGLFNIKYTQGEFKGTWTNPKTKKSLSFTGFGLDDPFRIYAKGIKKNWKSKGGSKLELNVSYPQIESYEEGYDFSAINKDIEDYVLSLMGGEATLESNIKTMVNDLNQDDLEQSIEVGTKLYAFSGDLISISLGVSTYNGNYGNYAKKSYNVSPNQNKILMLNDVISTTKANALISKFEQQIISEIKKSEDIDASEGESLIDEYVKNGTWKDEIMTNFIVTHDEKLIFNIDLGLPQYLSVLGYYQYTEKIK